MKKLIGKILLFVMLLWGVNQATHWFVPYFWGNDGWAAKYRYFREHSSEYNVLFMGSSQTYRQVNPNIFDNQLKNQNIKSFNFGYQATATPEVNYLYEQLLDDPSVDLSNVKVVFMDLQPVRMLNRGNASSSRSRYIMTPSYYLHSLELVKGTNASLGQRLSAMGNYTQAFFDKQFNVRSLKEMIEFRSLYQKAPKGFMKPIGENKDGFLPLNKDFRYKNRRQEFLECEQWYIPYSEEQAEYSLDCGRIEGSPLDKALLKECTRLIKRSRERGIHLVFLMPPRSPFLATMKVAERLGEEHYIALFDPRKYPRFYQMNHCYDRGHLNQRGARAYSVALAKESRQLIIEHTSEN